MLLLLPFFYSFLAFRVLLAYLTGGVSISSLFSSGFILCVGLGSWCYHLVMADCESSCASSNTFSLRFIFLLLLKIDFLSKMDGVSQVNFICNKLKGPGPFYHHALFINSRSQNRSFF